MTDQINLSEEEIVSRVKAANAKGFMNQMISGSGATAEQAHALYKKSDEKAASLIKKAELIRESILAEVAQKKEASESTSSEGLAENLKSALS
tara:strand:- start:331 stop:609 length:279 start_codon:yes stop_codon:yes gene_type:complete